MHSVKSVRIRSYSGLHFPAFGLNTERYGVSLRIQFKCGKMRTRITLNTDTFYAVNLVRASYTKLSYRFIFLCFWVTLGKQLKKMKMKIQNIIVHEGIQVFSSYFLIICYMKSYLDFFHMCPRSCLIRTWHLVQRTFMTRDLCKSQ